MVSKMASSNYSMSAIDWLDVPFRATTPDSDLCDNYSTHTERHRSGSVFLSFCNPVDSFELQRVIEGEMCLFIMDINFFLFYFIYFF